MRWRAAPRRRCECMRNDFGITIAEAAVAVAQWRGDGDIISSVGEREPAAATGRPALLLQERAVFPHLAKSSPDVPIDFISTWHLYRPSMSSSSHQKEVSTKWKLLEYFPRQRQKQPNANFGFSLDLYQDVSGN